MIGNLRSNPTVGMALAAALLAMLLAAPAAWADPDLVVDSVTVTPTVVPNGGQVDVTFTIGNTGDPCGGAGYQIGLYTPLPATILLDVLHTGVVLSSQFGDPITVQHLQVAGGTGPVRIGVTIDYDDGVVEDDESNNTTFTNLVLTGQTDFTVVVDHASVNPWVVQQGGTLSFEYEVNDLPQGSFTGGEVFVYVVFEDIIGSGQTIPFFPPYYLYINPLEVNQPIHVEGVIDPLLLDPGDYRQKRTDTFGFPAGCSEK